MNRGKMMYFIAIVAITSSLIISGCVSPPPKAATTPTPAQTQTPAGVAVEIKGFAFNPVTITVSKGTTVTWTNKDSAPHTVTSDTFDSGSLGQGQAFSYTFNEVGTFEYGCTIHPSIPHGKVIVTAIAAPQATPSPTQGFSVEVLKSPDTAAAGKGFEVSWRVNSPEQKNIQHTAVHYGTESKSEPLTLASYPSLTTPQSGTIPSNFSANITIGKAGVIYFRAHAIIDGTNYWSEEKMITVSAPANVSTTAAQTPTAAATTSGYGY